MTTITKRNGSVEEFNESKIHKAVMKCLTGGVGLEAETSGSIAEDITYRVLNVLRYKEEKVCVEDVQNIVEQQLMAAGHYEAARAYILYREGRRQKRDILTVDPEESRLLLEDKRVLKNPMQLFQHYSKYARWSEEKGRRESWAEAVNRVIGFFYDEFGDVLDTLEWNALKQALLRTSIHLDAGYRSRVLR